MSDAASTLEQERIKAEIRKLDAEAKSLAREPKFLDRHFLPIVTVLATLLAALSGAAAFMTAVAQNTRYSQDLARRESVLAAGLKEVTSEKKTPLTLRKRRKNRAMRPLRRGRI